MTTTPGRAWPWVLTLWTVVGCGRPEVDAIVDVSYDDRFAATRLDVTMPADPPPPGGRPAVLVIHGGGWRSLGRDTMDGHARRLAEAGYVTVNVDYRLVPAGTYPAAVQDVLCALSYTRAQAAAWGIDPARIATLGYSAGGHLASIAGVAADDPRHQPDCASGPTGAPAAVVSGAGPQDLAALPEVDAVIEFVGGTRAEVPDRYAAASPVTHVRPGAPPFLLVTGTDDWFVDADQARTMRGRLRDAGVGADLLAIPGGGHLFNRDVATGRWELVVTSIDTPEAWLAIIDFLDRTIGGEGAS